MPSKASVFTNNPEFLEEFSLSNTKLIIGSAIHFKIFVKICYASKSNYRNDIYGTDLVAYYQATRGFFRKLEKCSIEPIIVFPGLDREPGPGGKTTEEMISRKDFDMQRRLQKMSQSSETNFIKELVMPHITLDIFTEVAIESGARVVWARYSAGAKMVELAQKHGCPILVGKHGQALCHKVKTIHFNSLDFKEVLTGKSIKCRAFSFTKLNQRYPSFHPECVQLIIGIFDNVYLPPDALGDALKKLTNNNAAEGDFPNPSILEWFLDKSPSEAIEQFASLFGDELQDNVREALLTSVEYHSRESSSIEQGFEQIYPESGASVEYLRKIASEGRLCLIPLLMMFHERYTFYPILDDFRKPSSTLVCDKALAVLAALVKPKNYKDLTECELEEQLKRDTFITPRRVGDDIEDQAIEPCSSLEGFGSLGNMSMHETAQLNIEQRKSIILITFGISDEDINEMEKLMGFLFKGDFIQEASTCFLLLRYVRREVGLHSMSIVEGLLLTLYFYARNQRALNDDLSVKQTTWYWYQIKKHLDMKRDQESNLEALDLYRSITHMIWQLQACYHGYVMLNKFLDAPMAEPKIGRFLNSVLIFNLTRRAEWHMNIGTFPVFDRVLRSLSSRVFSNS